MGFDFGMSFDVAMSFFFFFFLIWLVLIVG